MATPDTDFEPYHKWLGIPQKRRPPTFYDLLALTLDEEDAEVIRGAAKQRRQFIEAQRGAGHDGAVASILYQIDEAELVLLNPELRRDYDRRLNLFQKRRRNRQVDPNVYPTRIESRPGRVIGEGSGIVGTFVGIMAVLLVGFSLMAWFSFQLPWFKQAEPTPEMAGVNAAPPAPERNGRPEETHQPAAKNALPVPVFSVTFDDDVVSQNQLSSSGVSLVDDIKGKAAKYEGGKFLQLSCQLPAGQAPRTLSAWIRNAGESEARNSHVISCGKDESGKNAWGICHVRGRWCMYGGGGQHSTEAAVDSEWHHHCLTFDGASLLYWLDGKVIANVSRTLDTTDGPITLGTYTTGSAYYAFTGVIDEVNVYDVALTEQQIKRLGVPSASLNSEADKKSDFPAPTLYLPFDSSVPTIPPDLAFIRKGGRSAAGRIGQAVSFDGNTYTELEASLPLGNSPRTLALWVRNDRGPVKHIVQVVTQTVRWERARAFGIIEAGGNWRFHDMNGGLDSGAQIDREWHHLAVTHDGTTIRFFLDGKQVAEADRNFETEARRLRIGGLGSPENNFVGLTDELYVFDVPLTEDQIRQLMNGMESSSATREDGERSDDVDSIAQRISNRTYPSVIQAREEAGNLDGEDKQWRVSAEVSATTGRNRVLIPAGKHGLNYFPDEVICILKEQPLTFTVVADGTYIMQGRSFETAVPVGHVLKPGPPGSPDNHYAGIGGIYDDKDRKRVMGFYHAEDKEGIGIVEANGVQGFYGTICAAEASTEDRAFRKLGPAISADKPKLPRGWETEGGPKGAWMAQGVGEPTVCIDGSGKYLLCYFVEWSNRLKRGVQICVARCPIETAGAPGSWQKYHNGKFSEPGLGGHETPVISAGQQADTYTPHVQYVKEWKRYVMVFGMGVGAEIHSRPLKAVQSGLYVTTSKDGVNWAKPVQIEKVFAFVINTQECKIHPTLIVSRVSDDTLSGQLLYGYTPKWPDVPHHLGSCPITIKLQESERRRDLEALLAGTKWINSNNVAFEWTRDGRFLHAGKEREWKVLDGSRVQTVFGPGHVDMLEFDDELKTFKQLIRGGPSSFTGRRQ